MRELSGYPDLGSTFKGINVLVAGGTGMVGNELVKILIELGANVRIASLDDKSRANPEVKSFLQIDLTKIENCLAACKDMDYAFNLLCSKGSPTVTNKYPLKFFEPMSLYNANLIKAAYNMRLGGYLLTSTVGVYPPAEIFREEDALTAMPSPNDLFAGFAKMHAEIHVRAYIQEGLWTNISIVRPANIYGLYDNFDGINAMVIPSLIKKAITASDKKEPFIAWGDGSPVRDFIHARDVARGMIYAAERAAGTAINLGSGSRITIRELTEIIVSNVNPSPKVVWDTTKPNGDKMRVMNTNKAESIGFKPKISLKDGIREVMAWYQENRHKPDGRYDVF